MKINRNKLGELVKDHYLSCRKHPVAHLWIYNYTQKAQYEKLWTPETLMCRGLIVDQSDNIIARPFNKFFNYEEFKSELPTSNFDVYEKMDGSLGILYWVNDEPFLATRGAFESEQAIKGTELLKKYQNLDKLNRNHTYLFEIIYPSNRIVVDYGAEEKIVLLAIIETETGNELPLESDIFEVVKKYDGIHDLKNIKEKQEDNKEGFVIKWPDGFRLKLKFDEYVRLHRLVTRVTARSIWDLLRSGQPFDELLERVPDEFFSWVKAKKAYFENEYTQIRLDADLLVQGCNLENLSRKEAAMIIKDHPLSAVVFKLLDKKDVSELIWKMLYPKHEIPFKTEI